ncbi:MAG: PAS domain S-box protein [Desulfovibrionaceae bacterium]
MDEHISLAVVGADQPLMRLVREALGALGHDVLAARDAAALRALPGEPTAALVVAATPVDIPDAVLAVRDVYRRGGVPVAVAVAADQDDPALARAIGQAESAGADDIWLFPARPAVLAARVRALVRRRGGGVTGFTSLFEDAPDAVVLADADTGGIVHANERAEALCGEAGRELVGLAFEDLAPASRRDAAHALFREQVAGLRMGRKSRMDWHVAGGDGRDVPVDMSMQLGTWSGRTVVLVIVRDMTDRVLAEQQIRASRETARAMIDAIRGDVVLVDTAGRLAAVNRSWAERMNTTPQEVVGRVFLSFFEGEAHALRQSAMEEACRTRGVVRFEEDRGDSVYDVMYCPVVGEDGEVRHLVGYGHDMTEYVKAKQALQEQLRFIQTLMNATPNPIFFKGFDGVYKECNAAFEEMLGRRREDIIGMGAMDVAPEELARQYSDMDRRMRDGEARQIYEAKVLSGSGELRDVIFNKAAYTNLSGQPVGIVGVVTDVTERKRAERDLARSEKKFRTLYEAASDAIMIMRGDMVADCNPAATVLFGKRREQIMGLNPAELCPGSGLDDGAGGFQARIDAAMNGKAQHFEWNCHRRDGVLCDVEVSLNKVALGGESYVQAIVRDSTARKQAERSMETARREAEAATRAKSIFLATMSHEIRTPLNVILGMTEQALRGSDPVHMRRMLQSVRSAGGTLLSVINDILDFSKIEAGKLDLERIDFNLHELLEEGGALYAFQAEQRGLTLDVSIAHGVPRFVKGDPGRLRQILGNLASNAIKFTQSGGIRISAASEPFEGHGDVGKAPVADMVLRFSVQDTGMGIMPDKLETVFENFSQADESVAREYGGTGLGLAISKRLVELMGGRISVRSDPGEGSVFTFTLPMDTGSADTRDAAGDEPGMETGVGAMRPLRVLVVEDNALNRELACRFLESEGHAVLEAVNGRQALDVLGKERVDVVLMDIQMPEMDGMSTTRAIRAATHLAVPADVPIIAMTAHALKGDRERFLTAGMTDYVAKPIDFMRLLAMLGKVARGTAAPLDGEGRAVARPDGTAAADPDKSVADFPRQDRDAGLALLGGNQALFRRLENIFLRDTPGDFEVLQRALEKGDTMEAARLAHSLKGSASTIGVMRLSALAKAMELALRNEDEVVARRAHGLLAAELEEVTALLVAQGVLAQNA